MSDCKCILLIEDILVQKKEETSSGCLVLWSPVCIWLAVTENLSNETTVKDYTSAIYISWTNWYHFCQTIMLAQRESALTLFNSFMFGI